jgi:hypothetical protein
MERALFLTIAQLHETPVQRPENYEISAPSGKVMRPRWGASAHVLQQCYREALFGKALLHKLPFTVGQLGFEHIS